MSTGKKVDKNFISHLTCTAQAHVLIFSCCSPAAVCWPEPEEGSGSYSSDQRPVLLAIARVSAVSVSAGGVSCSLSLSVSREVTSVYKVLYQNNTDRATPEDRAGAIGAAEL